MFITPDKLSQSWVMPERIDLPLGGRQGAYAAEAHSIRQEAQDFIENGSAPEMSARRLPQLSPEGAWLRERSQMAEQSMVSQDDGASVVADEGQRAFLRDIAPHAKAAGYQLGIAPELVAAHAALESGWGRRPLPGGNGKSGNNLFGIKASRGWKGEAVGAMTTEHLHGVDVKRVESFRVYGNLSDAFADYTRLLADSPRYREALGLGHDVRAFGEALARGGYATDPRYADKLAAVAARIGRID